MKKYYNLYKESDNKAVLIINGDITSYPYYENDVSSYKIIKELNELIGVDQIDVYINSYGGDVFEGFAIYNALKNHKAKIVTHVDGIAASIASIIFMAGEERIMPKLSMLVIHNPWSYTAGNANDLKKEAERLEEINKVGKQAYLDKINISDKELQKLLDAESWLSPDDALSMDFATSIVNDYTGEKFNQNIKSKLFDMMTSQKRVCKQGPKEEKQENIREDSNVKSFKNSFLSALEEYMKEGE